MTRTSKFNASLETWPCIKLVATLLRTESEGFLWPLQVELVDAQQIHHCNLVC